MIKAVIFDMDGIIVDSEPLWEESIKEVIATLGLELTDEARTYSIGFRIDQSVEYWNHELGWQLKNPAEVTNKILETVSAKVAKLPSMMSGVEELFLTVQNLGFPCAIASSSPAKFIKAVVDRFELHRFISFYHSAEYEKNGKPAPDVYLTAIKKLNQIPSECLAIEDTKNGITAAKSAGMKTLLVPCLQLIDFDTSIADYVVKSLSDFDLKSILEK